jgi:MFS family permease
MIDSMQLPLKMKKRSAFLGPSSQILGVLCLMYLVLYIDRVNIATLAPYITTDLHLNHTEFGAAVSAFSYPYALFQLFGGWLSDRFGARSTLVFCGVVVCIATICTGMAGGLGSLVAARLVLGFGEGAAFPTATRAMAVWLPGKNWGFAQGITHAAARLGNALTPPIVVGLLAYVSWRGSFVGLGLCSIIWILLWLWVTREGSDRHSFGSQSSEAKQKDKKQIVVPWLKLARRMLPVTMVDFCYGWTLWVFLTWLPLFFFQRFHLDLKRSALFSTGVLLGGVIGDTVGGSISDWLYRRTGSLQVARRNLIIVGMSGALIFLILVIFSSTLTAVAIYMTLACFFSELVVAPIWAVPMDITPEYAGTASGMMNFGFGLAGIISPVVFGKLLDLTGHWTVPFYGSLGFLLLGSALSFFMRPDLPFRSEHQ